MRKQEAKPASNKGRSPLKKPNEVDVYVGQRLRLRRSLLGYSQDELAAELGLSPQQVQKYESGSTRVSASRLFQVANVLDVHVAWFFDGLETSPQAAAANLAADKSPIDASLADLLSTRDAIDLLRSYTRIENPQMRKRLVEIARIMADEDES